MKYLSLLVCLLALALLLRTSGLAIDLNNDGMSDVWQNHYVVTALDRDLDWDSDGYSNFIESLYRTNPTLNGAPDPALDMFGIAELTVSGGTTPTVSWPTQDGALYLLEESTDLVVWTDSVGPIEGDGTVIPQTLNAFQSPIGFFRVYALQPEDSDGDQLDLGEERFLEFDPDNPTEDDDMDGIHDDWEMWVFGDLTTAGASTDSDGDGVLDQDEFPVGLNPNDIDTDNDGVSDGYETAVSSNPGAFDNPYQAPGALGLSVFTPILR